MSDRSGVADLVPVHGGLDQPVNRVVSLKDRKAFLAEAESLPSVRVSRADLSTVYRLGDGGLSPLEGPMDEESWHRVLDETVVLSGGSRYAWGIPLSLPIYKVHSFELLSGALAAVTRSRVLDTYCSVVKTVS